MADILVIDDDPTVLLFMKTCFSDSHKIYTFKNWSDAIPCFAKNNIDLALIDLNLKGLQGNDVVLFLRAEFKGKVFLFSAADRASLKQVANECGADGVIQKTLSIDYLNDEITRALQTKVKRKPQLRQGTVSFSSSNSEADEQTSPGVGEDAAPVFDWKKSNALFVKDIVSECRNDTEEKYLAKYPYHALMQLNRYEAISTGKIAITNDNPLDIPARLDPKDFVLFLLKSRSRPATGKVITIGRSSISDVTINSDRVSKFHGYLRQLSDGSWVIKDSISTNGTFLNGRKIEANKETPLYNGAIVSFSKTLKFKFITPSEMYVRLRMYRNIL
jgi:CheY-like chemotaxis protein